MDAPPNRPLYELLGATHEEVAFAEDFTRILNQINGLVGYAEDGNWYPMHGKVGALREALDNFDRRISEQPTGLNEPCVYKAPNVDGKRVVQLITAYAQTECGRLGPTLFPIGKLENPEAVAHIRKQQEASKRLRDELFGEDNGPR
ncbi:hypothetical protein ABZV65_30680 [Streptomyces bauhiniae]|uniref:hypothetical protein n=1 Tax=Streptomyces bauhiniae TaxID=2340725 RepID=UPI0033A5C409